MSSSPTPHEEGINISTLHTLVSFGRLCWDNNNTNTTTEKSQELRLITHSRDMSCPASDILFILGARLKSSPHLRPAILMREGKEQWQNLTIPLKMSAQAWHMSLPLTQLAKASHMAKPDINGQETK